MKALKVGCRVLTSLNKHQEAFWVSEMRCYSKKNLLTMKKVNQQKVKTDIVEINYDAIVKAQLNQ